MKPSRPCISQITEENNSITLTQVTQQIKNALNNIQENLDLNNNKITNLKDAETEFDAINKMQLDYYVKSLETKLIKSLEDKEKDLLTKISDLLKVIQDIRNRMTVIVDKTLELEIKFIDAFSIHTFQINESPQGDIIRVMPYLRNYTYAIHKILIRRLDAKTSKVISYDINSAWSNQQLLKSNATIQFYEVVESDDASDLGLYMHRLNNKPVAFGNTIKVMYSKVKLVDLRPS